jgi:UDP-N-acetylmuramoyl-tripeptide--D-alanyl-D-alanine ligase
VLGDMGELGVHTAEAHEEVGRRSAEAGLDWLLAVGRNAGLTAASARKAGFRQRLDAVADVDAARALLERDLKAGDLVLLKASRAAKLERVFDGLRKPSGKTQATA